MRAIRPHGPYVLGGHCYGGIVALEMARQLRAAGERVDVHDPGAARALGHALQEVGAALLEGAGLPEERGAMEERRR